MTRRGGRDVDPALLRREFAHVRQVTTFRNGLGVGDDEQGAPVFLATGLKSSWLQAWPAFRDYAQCGPARCAAGPGARVPCLIMRPAVMRRTKPSSEAEQQYQADVALAGRRAELLDAAREAEDQFRQARARSAPDAEVRRLAEDLDAALTEAMRAAYAAQRAEIGPRGYDDRIYRRKARATPKVHALTAEAERLLTLRETHRLNDIPAVPYDPAS